MKEKCFLTWKKKKKKKEKNIKSNPPLSLLPPKPTHTQKKIKARPPRCISGFIMGNNQKMPLNSWTCLFFPVLIWITKKRLYFTIHKFGWDYSRILHSSLQSLQDHNGGHGWKNRTNGEARLYKLLTKIRKSSTSLQFRLGWKTLEKKTAKTYYSSSRRSRSQSEQPRCISSLAKKQPLKHKRMINRNQKRTIYVTKKK